MPINQRRPDMGQPTMAKTQLLIQLPPPPTPPPCTDPSDISDDPGNPMPVKCKKGEKVCFLILAT